MLKIDHLWEPKPVALSSGQHTKSIFYIRLRNKLNGFFEQIYFRFTGVNDQEDLRQVTLVLTH